MWKDQITNKAATDENLKKRLLKDPKMTLASEFHMQLPDDVEVIIFEDTPKKLHLTLTHPAWRNLNTLDLGDEKLKAIAGGRGRGDQYISTQRWNEDKQGYENVFSSDGGKTWTVSR